MTTESKPPETTIVAKSEEESFLIGPRRSIKKAGIMDDDEPLIDTTQALTLKSKKTERLQKRQEKKLKMTTVHSETKSFLELPPELLQEILGYLRPSDIFRLLRLNKATSAFILDHEASITRDIIRRRYWTLQRCFHLPVALENVDEAIRPALLSANWQDRTQINKRYFRQHIPLHDPSKVCSCMTCVLAWNHLCLIQDLAHFQRHLSNRQPIPMIPRGTFPSWNTFLLSETATIVSQALSNPLHYAAILETHLKTTTSTLTRQVRVGRKTSHPTTRLFRLSASDIDAETDEYLERSGPPSYEFPVHRDKYYELEAYVPNRKWSREEQRWMYWKLGQPHENDLAWIVPRFTPKAEDVSALPAVAAAAEDLSVAPATATNAAAKAACQQERSKAQVRQPGVPDSGLEDFATGFAQQLQT